ncbi:hypothetical protein ACFQ1Q_04105 [Winogradskyella litorisediminis]|uniref:PH domain-containing protein n=1 Tax=Winogradskyella litorisediminis TaxID=1156618 RepID=A0ABW3N401_9FLAO
MLLREKPSKLKLIYACGSLVIGVISLISGKLIGLMFLIIGLYFFKSEGIEFNFQNKKFRNITTWMGFTFGKWQILPKIDYISVFKSEEKTRVWVSTASTVVSDTVIKVNLFYNGNHKIKAYETKSVEDAFKKAKEISKLLNIDILDATKRESEWC